MSRIELGIEAWQDCSGEALALARLHATEIGEEEVEPKRKHEIDSELMELLSSSKVLRIYTARVDSKLVGYLTWNISLDVESKGLVIAQQGGWFHDPKCKSFGLALKLFLFSVKDLQTLGVQQIFPHHRLRGRGKALGKFFIRLGAKPLQHNYSLWIGL